MWPATIRSAPAETSDPRTLLRRATGFFLDRHGAPIMWWWSTTIWYALREAARSRSSARVSCAVRTPPDWCRQGRTELRPITCSVGDEYVGSVVSHWRSNSRNERVNRAGNVYGM